jgi:hypothetical protein
VGLWRPKSRSHRGRSRPQIFLQSVFLEASLFSNPLYRYARIFVRILPSTEIIRPLHAGTPPGKWAEEPVVVVEPIRGKGARSGAYTLHSTKHGPFPCSRHIL